VTEGSWSDAQLAAVVTGVLVVTVAQLATTAAEAKDGSNQGTSTIPQSIANLTKTAMGTGGFAIPGAIAAGTGLLPALLIMSLVGSAAAYALTLIAKACDASGASSYKELGEAAGSQRLSGLMTKLVTTDVGISCLMYSLVIKQTVVNVCATFGLIISESTALIGATGGVILPLCLLKDLSKLAPASVLGLAGIFYSMWRWVFAASTDHTRWAGDSQLRHCQHPQRFGEWAQSR
jgi:amino acid permease